MVIAFTTETTSTSKYEPQRTTRAPKFHDEIEKTEDELTDEEEKHEETEIEIDDIDEEKEDVKYEDSFGSPQAEDGLPALVDDPEEDLFTSDYFPPYTRAVKPDFLWGERSGKRFLQRY